MTPAVSDDPRPVPTRRGRVHEMLLAASPRHRRDGADRWVTAALERREQVLTLSGPGDPPLTTRPVAALGPTGLDGVDEPGELVSRAREGGFTGLGVLVWADSVIAATSAAVHADIEARLDVLCRDQPVSALCVFDRPGAGTDPDLLTTAVGRHPDRCQEAILGLRRTAGDPDGPAVLVLDGEVDISNVDVLTTALAALTTGTGPRVRLDLREIGFLSAGACASLVEATTAFRDRGGQVELHSLRPHIARVLRVLYPDPPSGPHPTTTTAGA